MTTNLLVYAGLNSNSQEKTLRLNVPESKHSFYRTRERSRIKFKLSHKLRENNSTKRNISLLSSERKKDPFEQL